jgi:hypothetical protein
MWRQLTESLKRREFKQTAEKNEGKLFTELPDISVAYDRIQQA